MNPSIRDDFQWLVSEDAASVLAYVQSEFENRVNVVRIAKALRKNHSPSRGAVVMEQAQLRLRARRKFSDPSSMFFTRRGLEQASGRRIAAYKANRWNGISSVADICCGIGGDLIAMAKRDHSTHTDRTATTVGVDSDELTCLFAQKNLAACVPDSILTDILQIDFSDFSLSTIEAVHIDPDRRMKSRTVHGSQFSPSLKDVFERIESRCSLAVKVAPATPVADYFPARIQREWIGDPRECKQQVLWSGPATDLPGHRTATLIARDGSVHQVSVDEKDLTSRLDVSGKIQRYVAEPHPAVLAAKLTDHLANQYGMTRFTSDIVYLTGDRIIDDPLMAQFEVIDVLPLQLKQIRKFLASRDIGQIEVKRRGIEEEAGVRFQRLKLNGPQTATVILTRLGRERIAIVAKRIPNVPPSHSKTAE